MRSIGSNFIDLTHELRLALYSQRAHFSAAEPFARSHSTDVRAAHRKRYHRELDRARSKHVPLHLSNNDASKEYAAEPFVVQSQEPNKTGAIVQLRLRLSDDDGPSEHGPLERFKAILYGLKQSRLGKQNKEGGQASKARLRKDEVNRPVRGRSNNVAERSHVTNNIHGSGVKQKRLSLAQEDEESPELEQPVFGRGIVAKLLEEQRRQQAAQQGSDIAAGTARQGEQAQDATKAIVKKDDLSHPSTSIREVRTRRTVCRKMTTEKMTPRQRKRLEHYLFLQAQQEHWRRLHKSEKLEQRKQDANLEGEAADTQGVIGDSNKAPTVHIRRHRASVPRVRKSDDSALLHRHTAASQRRLKLRRHTVERPTWVRSISAPPRIVRERALSAAKRPTQIRSSFVAPRVERQFTRHAPERSAQIRSTSISPRIVRKLRRDTVAKPARIKSITDNPSVRRKLLTIRRQRNVEKSPEYSAYQSRMAKMNLFFKRLHGLESSDLQGHPVKRAPQPQEGRTEFIQQQEKRELDLSKLLESVDDTLNSWYSKPRSFFDPKPDFVKLRPASLSNVQGRRGYVTETDAKTKQRKEQHMIDDNPPREPKPDTNNKADGEAETPKKKKTIAEMDRELQEKMAGHVGDGGEAGVEYEDGKPVAMKRGVKENMFRYI